MAVTTAVTAADTADTAAAPAAIAVVCQLGLSESCLQSKQKALKETYVNRIVLL